MSEKTHSDIAEMDFETALTELEQIVGKLEAGRAPLQESIEVYERGGLLKAHCEKLLKQAEARIEKNHPRWQWPTSRHRAARQLESPTKCAIACGKKPLKCATRRSPKRAIMSAFLFMRFQKQK